MNKILFAVLFPFLCLAENVDFSFSQDNNQWVGDFCDYPIDQELFYELEWGWVNVPEMNTKGMFLSGNNHSDDLFMFIKRPIMGLKPNTLYDLTFTVDIVADVPVGHDVGVGGSPGQSVYFKVGAASIEPQKIRMNNFYYLNVDKGDQSQGGKNAIVVGTLGRTGSTNRFYSKQFKNMTPLSMKTDGEGKLWLFLGTDSGYEGTTMFFVTKISVQAEAHVDVSPAFKKGSKAVTNDSLSEVPLAE